MKLLTSPSFSSSSTSISPYQSNDFTTKRATISYLAGVLRRMLCSRSLPTHPSNQIMEEPELADDETDSRAPNYMDKDSSPGVVARLMGLESLPEMKPIKAPTSVSRSRSMSFVEHWAEECSREGNQQHPRVKACLSIREMPSCPVKEYEEFFVLSFERGDGSRELWSTQRRPKKGEVERFKTQKNSPTKKDPSDRYYPRRRNSTGISDVSDSVNITDLTTLRRKNKGVCRSNVGIKEVETEECSSEDASPVNVLDFGEWITDPEEAASASDDSTMNDSSARSGRNKKLSTELDNNEHSAASSDCSSSDVLKRPAREENSFSFGSRKKDFHPEMWSEIINISEAQIVDSNWVSNRIRDTEGIGLGVDLGLQVLDQLLDELVDQLVGRAEH